MDSRALFVDTMIEVLGQECYDGIVWHYNGTRDHCEGTVEQCDETVSIMTAQWALCQ